jgi:hypothetical protein
MTAGGALKMSAFAALAKEIFGSAVVLRWEAVWQS